ncbi:MAG TPA: alpha/beta hydrolase [bacterium]|nr:alpha/beta hydrolase [bacterium]
MFVNLNGKKMFFDVVNEGTKTANDGRNSIKPAMFALQGGPGMEHAGMKAIMEPFYDLVQVVLFDQRGSGLSDPVSEKDWSIELLSKDIEGLRKHLGFEKIILLGISFGGMLAMDYAITFPDSVSKLILAVTAPSRRSFEEASRFASSLENPMLRENAFKVLKGKMESDEDMKKTLSVLTPLYSKRRAPEKTLESLRHVSANSFVANYFLSGRSGRYDLEDRLCEISVPTLIMGSREDWICPISQSMIMKEKIPDSQLVVFENSGHEIFEDEKDKCISSIRAFLK